MAKWKGKRLYSYIDTGSKSDMQKRAKSLSLRAKGIKYRILQVGSSKVWGLYKYLG